MDLDPPAICGPENESLTENCQGVFQFRGREVRRFGDECGVQGQSPVGSLGSTETEAFLCMKT